MSQNGIIDSATSEMLAESSREQCPESAENPGAKLGLLKEVSLVARKYRVFLLVMGHLGVFCVIFYLAMLLRYETTSVFRITMQHSPDQVVSLLAFGLPFVAVAKLLVFYCMGNFHGWWRYVTFSDLVSLGKAATVSLIVIILVDHFLLPFQIPRKIVLVDWVLTMVILAVLRSGWRVWDEKLIGLSPSRDKRKRALMIGEDNEAARLAHLINSRPQLGVKVVGLVGTSNSKPKSFSDLKIVGSLDSLASLCGLYRTKIVYIASGALPAKKMRALIDVSTAHEFKINVVPKLGSFLDAGSQIPIREVKVDDLLRRPPAKLDLDAIGKLVAGKTVLVTGGGGSIGSELCRQLIRFAPSKLVMVGRGENRLYQIHRELNGASATEVIPALATITDRRRMDMIIKEYQPAVIFHAAAHKHVPLTEQNIGEAVVNNVLGTQVVAELADQHEVSTFVFVSTDKAVNPTSVMGCTKHIAERFCLALGSQSKTKFVVTRFGNVLGSAGSVVPLFKEQIQRGGPITITDERMTRFFMTIPEAAQLVVQAAAMGRGGEIFVLEMGQPVKIKTLAEDLIRLAGLPPESIDIKYTGIRPGEKLYEELYYNDEKSLPTSHDKILTAYHRPFEISEVREAIDGLISLAYSHPEQVRRRMEEMIPEFHQEHSQAPAAQQTTAN